MTVSKLRLKNMVFYGYHGVFDAERELGQRIEVDLELELEAGPAIRTDDFDAALNYVDVYTVVKEIVEEGEFKLIEAMAGAILDQLWDAFDLQSLMVRVRKPQPPVGGIMEAAEFELRKERDASL
ncbi:dihydroneopterin aldolase [Hydrogenispora ethanolica]|jgi:dihydroneopterin aldolase|uniref:7,8-dihydroneopterin aldolase n=1 Tax=Hydrogenispora ethanolica TaxID=1082276 RepID=A0A4R1S019_HYDET|nr:dihydroneopterin aldolase [Hydrogenispora ethanolica]TCL71612.1 dihydroneopterin aldolase [Hydrogenispora ethanolica]